MTTTNRTGLGTGWQTIKNGKFTAMVLAFEETSIYGINKGRISKLWIRNNETRKVACNYDRGWDVEPTKDVKNFYNQIIAKFN